MELLSDLHATHLLSMSLLSSQVRSWEVEGVGEGGGGGG